MLALVKKIDILALLFLQIMEEVKKKSSKLFITSSIEGVIPQNILGFTLILILAILILL